MTPEDWEKLQAAFEKALDISSEAVRAAYIAELHADDPEFAAEVQRMLDADDTRDDELEAPVRDAAASLGETAKDRWIGQSLGNYRLTRRIAVGGMSAVYLGRRDDEQFEQDVAIKLVGGHVLSDDLLTRFRTERQILASLKHPNIAQLFDGGTTDDGMPFLVMEYIDGLPIDEYCDMNALDIEQRLRLFKSVCSAVDYAHRNLIVHRDIKPSNILVTAEGIPKLLDFGIAKPLESARVAQTIAMTHANMRAMTPEYASPEQVRGETITTATDVYSLGVLLFKLLCGRMPYLLQGAGLDRLARAILEAQPSKPSTAITIADEENDRAPAIVAQRRTTMSALKKSLAGDLDTITLAALHKEPERRYPSARALSDDIERYLANEPVAAQPDSLAYRCRKFVTRNRKGVSAAAGVTVFILGLVAFYTWQVTVERDRAELEARKATEVVNYLSGIFRSASPYYTSGEDLTVRDVLAIGVESLESDLADQPEILAELLNRLGQIHQDIGMFDDALPLFERSLGIGREAWGEDDIRILPALLNIGSARREAYELEGALEIAEEGLAIAQAANPVARKEVAGAWHLIGNIQMEMEDYEASVESLRNAVDHYRELRPGADEDYALALHDLANMVGFIVGYEDGLALAEEAYAIKVAEFGRYHPAVAVSLFLQGSLQGSLGNPDVQERLYNEAIEIRERLFGREHPEFAMGLRHQATFLSSRQRWDDVEPLLDEALAVFEDSYGPDHYQVSVVRGMLSEVYSETGRTEAALTLAREHLDYAREQFGEFGTTTAVAYAEYADVLLEDYRDTDALAAFRSAVAAFETHTVPANTAYTRSKLGRVLLMGGDVAAAEPEILNALDVIREEAPPQHSIVARVLVAHGELLVAQGNYDGARAAAAEALEIMALNDQVGTGWFWIARTINASVMIGEGRSEEARAELDAIIAGLARENGTRSRAEDYAHDLLGQIDRSTASPTQQ